MFILRQEHLDAFAAESRETFITRTLDFMKQRFPETCGPMDDSHLRDRITDGIERAAAYRILSERDVTAFIRLGFVLGPRFDTNAKTRWTQPILHDETHPAQIRLRRIGKLAREKGHRCPR